MQAQIINNQQLTSGYYKMTLACEAVAAQAKAGQFVMLQVSDGYDPLLRRPFALHRRHSKGEIEIIYQVVGKGTSLMTKLPAGASIDVLGPLGRGFWMPAAAPPFLLVAGAIGVAPLLAWAENLIKGQKYSARQVLLLLGGKTQADLLAVSDFTELGIEVKTTTEDGSLGQTGLVTELLVHYLRQKNSPPAIFACGPWEMLKKVAALSQHYGCPCQLSLEAMMACGVGACQGCVVKTRHGKGGFSYQRVCREGPVFEAQDIVWE